MPLGTVTGTIQEFIDWALTIVSIMILWYVGKFFFVAPPTKEEKDQAEKEWEKKGKSMREWLGNKREERKTQEERKRKKDLTSPIRNHVVKAMESVSDVQAHLSHYKPEEAKKKIEKLKKHIKKAIRRSNELLANVEGGDREDVEKVITFLQAAQKEFLEKVEDYLASPKLKEEARITEFIRGFETFRASLGNVFKSLEQLHARK